MGKGREVTKIAHVATVDLTPRFLLLGQLTRLRDEGFEVVAISAPGRWVTDLEAEGIRHVAWRNATRAWDPRRDLKAFSELVAIFRRERFDLVHTHSPKPGVLGRIAARLAGVPCVANTVHGYFATPQDALAKRTLVLGAERLAARFSDLELFQSLEDMRWALRRHVVPASKAMHLGNGSDLTAFDPDAVPKARRVALRRELGIAPDEIVVGTVGRMVAEKGYREFFAAARDVRRRFPNVRFLAVGDIDADKGDRLTAEEVRAATLDVVFTGWRSDVRDLLSIMDVFVLASWREGLPRSAVEAAAMGKPLVVTDIRGCREVVRGGVGGLVVPPRDAEQLTEAISRVVVDDELRRRLGREAREVAVQRFDERRVADTVVEQTRRLLGRTGRPLPGGTPRVRIARRHDVRTMARLHGASMPDAFLPILGQPFLRQLYRTIVADPRAVAVVAEDGGRVIGFAAAVPSVRDLYRRFYRTRGPLAAVVALPRLASPVVMRRAIETARYPTGAGELPGAELIAIAVDDEHRARGTGRRLAAAAVDALAVRGVERLKVVVGTENVGANRFYEGIGFAPAARIEVHRGTASNVLVMSCRS
jgi:glycosyltransferase involved in cell wall biosynthesis/ribosomal protein S18 acetylase RimI-like enzyme